MPDNTTRLGHPVKPYVIKLPYDVAQKLEIIAKWNYLSPENWINELVGNTIDKVNVERLDRALRERQTQDKRWNS